MHINVASNLYIKRMLAKVQGFWDDAKVCHEGYPLEKNNSCYILHFQEVCAMLNLHFRRKEEYQRLKVALYYFIQKEHRFNIDGISIIDK